MNSSKLSYCLLVMFLLLGGRTIAIAPIDTKRSGEVSQPSWIDLFQDGYFFDFCISAVALPSSL